MLCTAASAGSSDLARLMTEHYLPLPDRACLVAARDKPLYGRMTRDPADLNENERDSASVDYHTPTTHRRQRQAGSCCLEVVHGRCCSNCMLYLLLCCSARPHPPVSIEFHLRWQGRCLPPRLLTLSLCLPCQISVPI